ncbi:thioredoxin family protein [Sinomonas flava]|uniref:Thioredoxin family protein n=1 Tax=Sinomonas flava TaxID=496857 RepID=A0ABN3C0E8_9MICC
MMFPPRIEVLYIEDCPQWQAALHLARSAARLAGAAEVDVFAIEVRSRQQALRLGFAGSPTILVGGRDPFPGVRTGRPACRVFQTPRGPAPLPDGGQLTDAIRAALAGQPFTQSA